MDKNDQIIQALEFMKKNDKKEKVFISKLIVNQGSSDDRKKYLIDRIMSHFSHTMSEMLKKEVVAVSKEVGDFRMDKIMATKTLVFSLGSKLLEVFDDKDLSFDEGLNVVFNILKQADEKKVYPIETIDKILDFVSIATDDEDSSSSSSDDRSSSNGSDEIPPIDGVE